MIKYSKWKFGLKYSGCTDCALHESRKKIVVDRGNPRAKIMILGEAPGEDEDLSGKCFVGKSGNLLHQQLKYYNIDSNQDVLIANAVKCRPPDNRAPKKGEIKACSQYLEEQIKLVKPVVLVLLGSSAAFAITGRKVPMSAFAGKIFDIKEFPDLSEKYPFLKALFVNFHPASVFYAPELAPKIMRNWSTLKVWLEKNNV